jgi:hypothetical protein
MFAQQAQGPEFKPQCSPYTPHTETIKEKKKKS